MIGKLSELQKEKNEQCTQRHELAVERLRTIVTEETVNTAYISYFQDCTLFLLELENTRKKLEDGSWDSLSLEEKRSLNRILYSDIIGEKYQTSYANQDYACEKLGQEMGQLLSLLYTEIRAGIPYVFEQRKDYLTILYELFLEVYTCFEGMSEEENPVPKPEQIKEILYWYASDYCDVFYADRILEQMDPSADFAVQIIEKADLDEDDYLYEFGEYISKNELGTAHHLRNLPQETLQKMADVYTEGYRVGFINTGKDLSKKSIVNIRYSLGFERMVKAAILQFEKMGLKPVIYRHATHAVNKRGAVRVGYTGGVANPQYDYDHRQDSALFLDGDFVQRKLRAMQTSYEKYRELAEVHGGPACIDTFGENPFSPVSKPEAYALSEAQQKLQTELDNESGQIVNRYIKGEERSFTIIAYPVPAIGDQFEEIFRETVKINTLDYNLYQQIQQKLIDALDLGTSVHILGKGENRTDLRVQLHKLEDPEKQTNFENCVADVNIPVGEVFTSPKLTGTNGKLHVTKVYLNELQYQNLELVFTDGKITEYSCTNFDSEEENKKYIRENILYHHPTLPMGEFAIGTNTTAYRVAREYGIEAKLPILIAEKTGPHFAVGDTCYSWAEDTKVYNPDGKEIIARDNEVSILRKEDVSKAYLGCHTDITIPYDELGAILVETADGREIPLIQDGRFVLAGTEELNKELDALEK